MLPDRRQRAAKRAVGGAILAALLAAPHSAFPQSAERPWVVRGATLLDGTGAPAIRSAIIAGQGSRITCVGTSCIVPTDASMLDATGKWIVPGLIDTHVHLNWEPGGDAPRAQLQRFALGITTTRDAGTPARLESTLAHRPRADAATSPEPRLVVSAVATRFELKRHGVADFEALVRTYIDLGVDAIKLKGVLTPAELDTIFGAARAQGLPVWGHTTGTGLKKALDAGIDGLPHLKTFSTYALRTDARRPPAPDGIDAWVWSSEEWHYVDDARLHEIVERIVRQGVWVEPGLATEKYFTLPYPIPAEHAYLGDVPSLRGWIRSWMPFGEQGLVALHRRRARIAAVFARQCAFVRDLHDRGGVMITGTDLMEPGLSVHDEMRLLADCGLSPMDALQAATRHSAAALRRTDLGTIEPGRLGDFLVLDADPLLDITNVGRIWRVVKGGQAHDPAALVRPRLEAYRSQLRRAWVKRALAGSLVFVLVVGAGLAARRFIRGRARNGSP